MASWPITENMLIADTYGELDDLADKVVSAVCHGM